MCVHGLIIKPNTMSTQIPSHLLEREEMSRHVHFDEEPVHGTPIPAKMRAEHENEQPRYGVNRKINIALALALLALILALFTYYKLNELIKAKGLAGGSNSNPYFSAVTRT